MLSFDRRRFIKGATAAGVTVISRPARAAKLKPAYPMEGPVTKAEYSALKKMVIENFKMTEVTLSVGTFHVPAHGKYSSLFSWDSGWHAIGMSRIDPAAAASEIDALFALQCENGRISHDTHFPELEKTQANWQSKLGSFIGRGQFDDQGRSEMIDPPAFVVACEKIFERGQDRSWLDKMLPKLDKYCDYLKLRDLFGCGTVAVIHPWETGTDSSPCYDQYLKLDFRTPLGAPTRMLLYPSLIQYNARFKWDLEEAKKRNRFILEDVCFNAIVMRAFQAVANLHEKVGNASRAAELRARAQKVMDALDRNNWVEAKGLWNHRYDLKNPKIPDRTTCASLLPLMTGLPSKERAERALTQHALKQERFWTDYLYPFNPADEMEGDVVYYEDLLLWRGRCIWTNMNWMMVHALKNYGRNEEARELTRRTVKMVLHEGMREFYDFRNGEGKGQVHFNWPSLAVDMIHETWPEAVAG